MPKSTPSPRLLIKGYFFDVLRCLGGVFLYRPLPSGMESNMVHGKYWAIIAVQKGDEGVARTNSKALEMQSTVCGMCVSNLDTGK